MSSCIHKYHISLCTISFFVSDFCTYTYVCAIFYQRKYVVYAFMTHVRLLYIGLTELQVELGKDINRELISTMCVRNEKDNCIQFKCFLSAASLLKFADEFQCISGNEMFLGVWRRTLNQAISDKPRISLRDIYDSVWQPSLQQCRNLLESLEDQSMKLSDIDTNLQPYHNHLDRQLELLYNKMADISQKSGKLYLIKQAAQRVREYWNLCQYQKGADTFLKLKNSLGLTKGDFQLVERLSQQVYVTNKD